MLKKMKGLITGASVILAVSTIACTVFASAGEQKTSVLFDKIKVMINSSETDLTDVKCDEAEPFIHNGTTYVSVKAISNYVPLSDINSEKVVEHTINENQIIINGGISSKTQGYTRILEQNPDAVLLVDEKENYISVGEIEKNGGYSDICITKYDSSGIEVKKQTYGGSDFDWTNAAKYNSQIGIVISGISQSSDGDFANNSNSPFVACIDPETLEVKWVSSVQVADWVYHVSDEAVYVVHNEGEKYNGKNELKLSIVKLDGDGNKIWSTEPLSQWIYGITELRDGRVIGIQKFSDNHVIEKSGAINCYSKAGEKLLTFEADCYGDIEPTNDGGFIIVSVRNIKTVPQPAYISSIWYDTETVATKYDKNYKIEWRKTYDSIKHDIGIDRVFPLSDGSVALE